MTVGVLRATLARHDWAHKPSEGLHYRASELVVQPAGTGGGQAMVVHVLVLVLISPGVHELAC